MWWSSGQHARRLLRRSEFESRWCLLFICKICVSKEYLIRCHVTCSNVFKLVHLVEAAICSFATSCHWRGNTRSRQGWAVGQCTSRRTRGPRFVGQAGSRNRRTLELICRWRMLPWLKRSILGRECLQKIVYCFVFIINKKLLTKTRWSRLTYSLDLFKL